ncbi:MAG: roadblock/LC7 domain-containing protein [Chloroflexi bacterium]|nr:roadblock/LC7 domain-containing protein [Chloroflexota bacterium]
MKQRLQEINSVLGVVGSFVCMADGSVAAQELSDRLDEDSVAAAARIASQTFAALESTGQRPADVDLVFYSGRLLLKNLRGAILAIVCVRSVNIPLVNLTANVAAKKLSAVLKAAKPGGAPDPAASAAGSEVAAPADTAAAPAADTRVGALSETQSELQREMERVVSQAQQRGVVLKVIGSPATPLICPNSRTLLAPGEERQLDFAARSSQAAQVSRLFQDLGYRSNQRFNAFYGSQRLNFGLTQPEVNVDVYLDTFEMYQRLDLSRVLAGDCVAPDATTLLLLRLQLVEMTDAALLEICALLLEHELSVGADQGGIDASQVTSLCADDWGWFKTVTINLERVQAFTSGRLSGEHMNVVSNRARRLAHSVAAAPKSLRWQARARIGETVRWYETPVDSRSSARPGMAFG